MCLNAKCAAFRGPRGAVAMMGLCTDGKDVPFFGDRFFGVFFCVFSVPPVSPRPDRSLSPFNGCCRFAIAIGNFFFFWELPLYVYMSTILHIVFNRKLVT